MQSEFLFFIIIDEPLVRRCVCLPLVWPPVGIITYSLFLVCAAFSFFQLHKQLFYPSCVIFNFEAGFTSFLCFVVESCSDALWILPVVDMNRYFEFTTVFHNFHTYQHEIHIYSSERNVLLLQ